MFNASMNIPMRTYHVFNILCAFEKLGTWK